MAQEQGPTPMALGSFTFRALGFSFVGQEIELETPWAEIDVCYRFAALQWTGPKSDSFAIKGILFEEAFGGLSSLEGIADAAKSGTPLMLVTFSGKVHGRHAIQRVSQERDNVRFDGLARRNGYSIQLRRI
jgi:hypothetical protein